METDPSSSVVTVTGAVSLRSSIEETISFLTSTDPVRASSVSPVTDTVYSPSNNLLASSISADVLSSDQEISDALTATEPFLTATTALVVSTAVLNSTLRVLASIAQN